MILNLEKLRRDSKLFRKKDAEIFMRINILLEYSKIEVKSHTLILVLFCQIILNSAPRKAYLNRG